MWTYLLVYSEQYSHEAVEAFVQREPTIINWIRCLPFSYFVVSTQLTNGLTGSFVNALGMGRFFIVDVGLDNNGFLPRAAWNMIRNPAPPGLLPPRQG